MNRYLLYALALFACASIAPAVEIIGGQDPWEVRQESESFRALTPDEQDIENDWKNTGVWRDQRSPFEYPSSFGLQFGYDTDSLTIRVDTWGAGTFEKDYIYIIYNNDTGEKIERTITGKIDVQVITTPTQYYNTYHSFSGVNGGQGSYRGMNVGTQFIREDQDITTSVIVKLHEWTATGVGSGAGTILGQGEYRQNPNNGGGGGDIADAYYAYVDWEWTWGNSTDAWGGMIGTALTGRPQGAGLNPFKSHNYQPNGANVTEPDAALVVDGQAVTALPPPYYVPAIDGWITYLASPAIMLRKETDSWSRKNKAVKVAYGYSDDDGRVGLLHAGIYITRINNPPDFENPGTLSFSVPNDPETQAESGTHTITQNNVLPYLTAGGAFGDPWEEIYDSMVGNPEDSVTISSRLLGIGFTFPASIPVDGVVLAPRFPQISGLSMSVSTTTNDPLTVGGTGSRQKANMTLSGNMGDAGAVTLSVEATANDGEASTTKSFAVNLVGAPASGILKDPPRRDLVYASWMTPAIAFPYGMIATMPPSASGLAHAQITPAALYMDSDTACSYINGVSRWGYLPDWHKAKFPSPTFPPIYIANAITGATDDDAVWKRDNNTEYRGFVAPLTWRGLRSDGMSVVAYDYPEDYTEAPSVVSGQTMFLPIRWKWNAGSNPGSGSRTYTISVNFNAASGYLPLSTPITLSYSQIGVASHDNRPVNRQFGVEARKGGDGTTEYPHGDISFDGRSLVMPWIHGDVMSMYRRNYANPLTSGSADADWSNLYSMAVGYVLTPVDVGDIISSSSVGGKVGTSVLADAIRRHTFRIREVGVDGVARPLRPYHIYSAANMWPNSEYANFRNTWLKASPSNPTIIVKDSIGRIATDPETGPAAPTAGEAPAVQAALTTVYGSVASAVALGETRVPKQVGSTNWSSYSNARYWSLRGAIQHNNGSDLVITNLRLLDQAGHLIDMGTSGAPVVGQAHAVVPYWEDTATNLLVAKIPLGRPNAWDGGGPNGPQSVNLIYARNVQSVPAGIGVPVVLPHTEGGNQASGLRWATGQTTSELEAGTTAGTAAVAWGSSCMVRSDDELYAVVVLRSDRNPLNPSSATAINYQWTSDAELMRLDLLDATEQPKAELMSSQAITQSNKESRPQTIVASAALKTEATVPIQYTWDGPTAIAHDYTITASYYSYAAYMFVYDIPASNPGVTETVTLSRADLHASVTGLTINGNYWYVDMYGGTGFGDWWGSYQDTLEIPSGADVHLMIDASYFNPLLPPSAFMSWTTQSGTIHYSLAFDRKEVVVDPYYGTTYSSDQSSSADWAITVGGTEVASGNKAVGSLWDEVTLNLGAPETWGVAQGAVIWNDAAYCTLSYAGKPATGPWLVGANVELSASVYGYNLGSSPTTLFEAEPKPDPYPIISTANTIPLVTIPSIKQATIQKWMQNTRSAMMAGEAFEKHVIETRSDRSRMGMTSNPYGGWSLPEVRKNMIPEFVLVLPYHMQYSYVSSTDYLGILGWTEYPSMALVERYDMPQRAYAVTTGGVYNVATSLTFTGTGDLRQDGKALEAYALDISFTPAEVGMPDGIVLWAYAYGNATSPIFCPPPVSGFGSGASVESGRLLTVGGDTITGKGMTTASGRFAACVASPKNAYAIVAPNETVSIHFQWRGPPSDFRLLMGERYSSTWSANEHTGTVHQRLTAGPTAFYATLKRPLSLYETAMGWGRDE